jgi:hypothetical protein
MALEFSDKESTKTLHVHHILSALEECEFDACLKLVKVIMEGKKTICYMKM